MTPKTRRRVRARQRRAAAFRMTPFEMRIRSLFLHYEPLTRAKLKREGRDR